MPTRNGYDAGMLGVPFNAKPAGICDFRHAHRRPHARAHRADAWCGRAGLTRQVSAHAALFFIVKECEQIGEARFSDLMTRLVVGVDKVVLCAR
jgi:hypothetical protein